MKVAVDNFAMLACREASLAIVGIHHEPTSIDLMRVCYSNWHINGCGSLPIETAIVDILAMMKSGQYDLASLVTLEYGVEQIAEALVVGSNAQEAQKVCIVSALLSLPASDGIVRSWFECEHTPREPPPALSNEKTS